MQGSLCSAFPNENFIVLSIFYIHGYCDINKSLLYHTALYRVKSYSSIPYEYQFWYCTAIAKSLYKEKRALLLYDISAIPDDDLQAQVAKKSNLMIIS